jgi:UDP-4-amino-4,6-dideoxy-N-acetyl-beta-L-altrosamine transaminase
MIPYGRQEIVPADIDAVVEVLRSDLLTQGPMVTRFEKTVADYCGAKHAVAVNSATSALHTACIALDLGPGDWLWTTPNTFVASANCALYCGARVDFVDIDPRTYNLCTKTLTSKLQQAEREGRLPKVIIPVHYAGQPCDMPTIYSLSKKYGFKIIEDASHAIGASYTNGRSNAIHESVAVQIGSCTHSHVTVFSFHPVKIITTGEGGIATTNDQEIADRLTRLRAHGITRKPELMTPRPEREIWTYQQIELGFNYRMTDIQAALGISQMNSLSGFIERRRAIAAEYDRAFADIPVITPWQAPGLQSSYHLYPICIRESDSGKTQRQVYDALWQKGIAANLHYIPVHRQPYYEAMGFRAGDFPETERYHQEAISLPIYSSLSKNQQACVINALTSEFR